ncbi:MAG: D-alanyl-D-alanine carboxypeptidase [Lachnospiraceae bacterium]|nr:D-alanyl-D-alanine carboxypeptidase [Lachnospiraceae bacterium]
MRKSVGVKKHRVNYKGRVFTLPLVIFMVMSFSLRSLATEAPDSPDGADVIETNEILNWPKGPETSGRSVILMENSTGAILYAKNIHERCYPAAMTAVVTSMLAAEMCDLDDEVEFSTQAVRDVPSGVVNIAIDPGERLSVGECLQAILIRGAAECGFALAEHCGGGSRDAFVALMNSRAASLGCTDTSFTNPVGLHSEEHYTTAYDMALIGRDFFDNELLCKYSLQKTLHLYPSEGQKDEIIEHNASRMAVGGAYEYEYLIGARTGYTDEAGYCLIAGAEKDGMRLIAVIMDDGSDERYQDAIALFDYGFSNFTLINASENEKSYDIGSSVASYGTTDIMGDSSPMFSLDKNDRVLLPLTVDFADLTSDITYDGVTGNEAARIEYSYRGTYLGKCSILFGEPSDEYDFGIKSEEETPAEEKPGKTFVFINVAMVALVSAIIAAGILLLMGLYKLYKRYRKVHPNWRRQYRKERHRSVFSRWGGNKKIK